MPRLLTAALALTLTLAAAQMSAQTADNPSATTTITTRSTLVLVPALVREKKSRQLVFSLKADDFVLTDNGVPQKIHLETDTGGEPLALVVDIEGGGAALNQINKFSALSAMIDSVVGAVPHKVAIVGYDSSPVLVQDFTPNIDLATHGIEALIADNNGDGGAATLDSLAFSVNLLRKQPTTYRRAILLISESNDYGSKTTLAEALRAISDTNTVIYAIGFSSAHDHFNENAIKSVGNSNPGPAHGCMSRDPNDPNVNLNQSVASQAYDCLSLLVPPLGLAKAAAIAAFEGFRKNIPETVANLTGGEYYKLGSEKNFERDLHTISNHMPNRYIISFQPPSPRPGLHAISLTAPDYKGLEVTARRTYWADPTSSPMPPAQ